ncbi:hypothetical protein L218DRAFT_954206 [Marasmius fiardii PR-910]|nr:hypothetical protein L218DRAFT_954206 [Marasmius fiardii PR-910]
MILFENENQQPNISGVIHIVRDLRGPVMETIPGERPHILDDLEYLQNGQPFVGTDEHFHAEPLDLGGSSFGQDCVEEAAVSGDSVGAYPPHIMRAVSLLEITSSVATNGFRTHYHPRHFYHFWKLVMSFFFPSSEGYTCQHDWLNPTAELISNPSSSQSPTSLAVFRDYCSPYRHRRHSVPSSASRYPVALIQIFSPLDFSNGLLRETAARQTLNQFEELAPYTSHETVLVVSAMGKAWRAWQKDTHFTDEEVRRWGIANDENVIASQEGMRDSEWMEDISSEVSRDILSRMCEDIKSQFRLVSPRRRVDRRGRRSAF